MTNPKLGLHIMASEVSFSMSVDAIDTNEDTIQFTPMALKVSYDFFACFSKMTTSEDGTPRLCLNPIQQYTEETKSKLETFINTYKEANPRIKAMEQKVKRLKIGEYICILESNMQINTEQTIDIYNELGRLNEGKVELNVPLFKEYNMHPYGEKPHTNIGHQSKSLRVCRWCGGTTESNNATTFNKKAHAIAEALGNKNLVLLDECDVCNENFGKTIEQSIIALFSFFNTFWGVIGKNGVPKIKHYSEQTNEAGEVIKDITEVEYSANRQLSISLSEQYFTMKDGKPVGVKIKVAENYIEQDVYKSLCKYALSLVEQEDILPNFSEIIEWIKGKKDIDKLPIVKTLFTYAFFPQHPKIHLYIRKTDNEVLPFMFAEFQYKNFVLIYIVPRNQKEAEKFLNTDNFSKFWETTFYSETVGWIDWDFSDKIPRKLYYDLKFEQREE